MVATHTLGKQEAPESDSVAELALKAFPKSGVQHIAQKVISCSQASPLNFAPSSRLFHDTITSSVRGAFMSRFIEQFRWQITDFANFLEATPKTVRRRQTSGELPTADVERMARFIRVWATAVAVFEDDGYAMQWLFERCEALGSRPVDLLKSGDGERLVLDELGRIDHGMPA